MSRRERIAWELTTSPLYTDAEQQLLRTWWLVCKPPHCGQLDQRLLPLHQAASAALLAERAHG